MSSLSAIQCALEWIETRLTEPVSLEDIARHVGMSLWHFQRTFTAMVGEPAGGYLRRRRLTEAARFLRATDCSILDVALEYQFESHEAFTRAFKAEMLVTPSAWRTGREPVFRGRRPHLLTSATLDHRYRHMKLMPEIITLPARTFIGLQARFISAASPDANNLEVIPKLWESFFARIAEIEPVEHNVGYGLCDCTDATGQQTSRPDEIYYLASVSARPDVAAPEGMVAWNSPAGTYAKFIHRGRVERIGQTMGYIYGKWLQEGEYESGDGPDLERYDTRFDPASEESILEIFVPVRRAKGERSD